MVCGRVWWGLCAVDVLSLGERGQARGWQGGHRVGWDACGAGARAAWGARVAALRRRGFGAERRAYRHRGLSRGLFSSRA